MSKNYFNLEVNRLKIINKFPDFSQDKSIKLLKDGWISLKEPQKTITSFLISIPFMIVMGFISLLIINLFAPISLQELGITVTNDNISFEMNLLFLPIILFAIISLTFIHELIHVIFIPDFLHSEDTYIGFTWFGGFTYTEKVITKERFIIISVMPYVILSLVFPVILGLLGFLTPTLKLVLLLNAISSSVDGLNIAMVLYQIPKKSKVIMNGRFSYFKVDSKDL